SKSLGSISSALRQTASACSSRPSRWYVSATARYCRSASPTCPSSRSVAASLSRVTTFPGSRWSFCSYSLTSLCAFNRPSFLVRPADEVRDQPPRHHVLAHDARHVLEPDAIVERAARTREHRRHREEERALARSHLGHHHVGRLAAAAETALPPHLDVRVEAGPPDLLHERGVEPRRLAHLAALPAATHDDPVALHSPMALRA